MKRSIPRSIWFLLFGLFFLYLSLIAFRSLSPDFREKMFQENPLFVYCQAYGCLKLAEWDVQRTENRRMTGETVPLCSFHRWKVHDSMYVPQPVKGKDIIVIGLLFLFTSLLCFFPGLRLGSTD